LDVATSLQVQEQVDASEIGAELKVKIIRKDKIKTLTVKPGDFPQNVSE
jgi:S1-C subfamily serine protease